MQTVVRWVRDLQATRWVLRLGVLGLVLTGVLGGLGSALAGPGGPAGPFLAGLGVLVMVLAAWGVVLRAFWARRRWAWWVLVVGQAVQLGAAAHEGPGWSSASGLLYLALLLHPDSQEWVQPEPPRPIGGPIGPSAGPAVRSRR